MKKLTAGIFATILGVTAMGAADAAQVASTNYVQSALESLDSSATATEGSALTGVTVVDGKIISKTEVALPTPTNLKAELDSSASATEGQVVTGVTMTDGEISVTSGTVSYNNLTDKPTLFTNADRDSAEKGAQAGYALSAVAMENGEFAIKEVALPTTTNLKAELDSSASATEGQVVTGVSMTDGTISVTSGTVSYNNLTDKPTLFTNVDRDSAEKGAQAGYALSAVAMENGEFAIKEVALPTTDGLAVKAELDSSASATEGQVVTGVTMTDGAISVTSGQVSYNNLTDKPTLFTNSDVNGGTADAGSNKLLQSVKLENGALAAVTTVEIVDTYVAPTPAVTQ